MVSTFSVLSGPTPWEMEGLFLFLPQWDIRFLLSRVSGSAAGSHCLTFPEVLLLNPSLVFPGYTSWSYSFLIPKPRPRLRYLNACLTPLTLTRHLKPGSCWTVLSLKDGLSQLKAVPFSSCLALRCGIQVYFQAFTHLDISISFLIGPTPFILCCLSVFSQSYKVMHWLWKPEDSTPKLHWLKQTNTESRSQWPARLLHLSEAGPPSLSHLPCSSCLLSLDS